MKIISFLNMKGGVGKTTSCYQIAGFLNEMNKKTLVIDLDPQTNLTNRFKNIKPEKNIINLFLDDIDPADLITKTDFINIDIITSTKEHSTTEILVLQKIGTRNIYQILNEVIEIIKDDYEYILIDCPPAMTGEDFGYLLSKVPGVMFWLGIDTPYALHHPKMSPNEDALAFAVAEIGKFLKHKAEA